MPGKSQYSLREVKSISTGKKKSEMNLNSKFNSRRSDGLHCLEEGFKITGNIYFHLQNYFLFMHLEEEKEEIFFRMH